MSNSAATQRMLAVLDAAVLELAEEHVPHSLCVQVISSCYQFIAETVVNAVLGAAAHEKQQFATAQNAFQVDIFCFSLFFFFFFLLSLCSFLSFENLKIDQNGSGVARFVVQSLESIFELS